MELTCFSKPAGSHELSLSDIRAQWPQETIFASTLCQRALEDTGEGPGPVTHTQKGWIIQPYNVDPKTFVEDLNTLMDKSDEVILAGLRDAAVVLSPSGQSVATYNEVRVIRSWRGPHHPGDILIFGVPVGSLPCEPSSPGIFTRRFDVQGPYFAKPDVYVLFLRQAKPTAIQVLQDWRGQFPEAKPADFVFPSERYGALPDPVTGRVSDNPVPYSTDPSTPIKSWKVSWTAARKLAGVSCRWHDARHSFVSLLTEGQASDATIMALAGHLSRKMMERYSYTRLEAKRSAISAIDSVIAGEKSTQFPPQCEDAETSITQ